MRISVSNAGYTTFRGRVRVLATHSTRQFPLHFPSRASTCATTFRTQYITLVVRLQRWTTCNFQDFFYSLKGRKFISKHFHSVYNYSLQCVINSALLHRPTFILLGLLEPWRRHYVQSELGNHSPDKAPYTRRCWIPPHPTAAAPPISQHITSCCRHKQSQTGGEKIQKGFEFGQTFLMVGYSNGNQKMALGLSGSQRQHLRIPLSQGISLLARRRSTSQARLSSSE